MRLYMFRNYPSIDLIIFLYIAREFAVRHEILYHSLHGFIHVLSYEVHGSVVPTKLNQLHKFLYSLLIVFSQVNHVYLYFFPVHFTNLIIAACHY